jgi:hypothetical protein
VELPSIGPFGICSVLVVTPNGRNAAGLLFFLREDARLSGVGPTFR